MLCILDTHTLQFCNLWNLTIDGHIQWNLLLLFQVQKQRHKSLSVFGTLVSPKLRAAQFSFETGKLLHFNSRPLLHTKYCCLKPKLVAGTRLFSMLLFIGYGVGWFQLLTDRILYLSCQSTHIHPWKWAYDLFWKFNLHAALEMIVEIANMRSSMLSAYDQVQKDIESISTGEQWKVVFFRYNPDSLNGHNIFNIQSLVWYFGISLGPHFGKR